MKLIKTALLAGALVLAGGNTKADWNTTVAAENQGHNIGNPKAETTLTEYISYTCPHCATFAQRGDRALKIGYVHTGKMNLQIRHLIRDPVDLTATMLTHCGDTRRFTMNHNAFMYSQAKWLPIMQSATQAQIARWTNSDRKAARRAIARDFGFYDIMGARGYGVTDVDKCLNDDAKAQALVETSAADARRLGLRGTPSFVLDGELLGGVHSWEALEPVLNGQPAPEASSHEGHSH